MWRTVVLTAPPKAGKRDGAPAVKSGCHLIWPELFVDDAIALQLRLNVVAHLKQHWPARPDANPYEDVVDKSVLTSNGLRMYGSDKGSVCPTCRRQREKCKACKTCQGRGAVIENRAYTLGALLTPSGKLDEPRFRTYSTNLLTCVRNSSTRTSQTHPSTGFAVPPDAVSDDSVKRARRKRPVSKGCLLDMASPVTDQLRAHICTMNTNWANLVLKEVVVNDKLYLCHVTGPGALFCTNAKRAHTSSTIYFTIGTDGIRQRCFSHKGTCRQYQGPSRTMSRWLSEALFGRVPKSVTKSPYTHEPHTLATYSSGLRELATKHGHATQQEPHPDYPGLTHGQVKCIVLYCQEIDPSKSALRFRKEVQTRCTLALGDPLMVYRSIKAGAQPAFKKKPTK
jgi:hypothetical protein